MATWLVFRQVEQGFHGWRKDLEPEAVLTKKMRVRVSLHPLSLVGKVE